MTVADTPPGAAAGDARVLETPVLETLFAGLAIPVAHLDSDAVYVRVNRLYAEACGRSEAYFPGRRHFDLSPDPDVERLFHAALATGRDQQADARPLHRHADAVWDWVLRPVAGADGRRGVVLSLADATRRLALEREARCREGMLRRVNRALKALSAGNQAIIHAESEPALLEEMCRAVVDAGGYPYAGVVADDRGEPAAAAERAAHGRRPAAPGATWTDLPPSPQLKGGRARLAVAAAAADGGTAPALLSLPVAGEGGMPFGRLVIAAAGPDGFDPEEIRLLEEMAADLAFGLSVLRLRAERLGHLERLERSLEGTVAAIAATVELRDPYTAGHQRRVAGLARAIAETLGLPADAVKGIAMAAGVHDIGKISVPAEILTRPGRLSPAEYGLVKAHAEAGYEILRPVDAPWPLAELVRQHHERMDGSGYPLGLAGEAILPGARIIAVADVIEAMACHRPYRPALGIDAALDEVRRHRGTLYDGAVVDACVAVFRERRFAL
ncbi:HD domain-containing phosphohydrolase [Azospirillum sp. ST 5-10]|uniref:HD domain-containing phosphohydrolase n=1 Tax=unclassified Azospirillum TaxID=2630922 RepID=UPI003F4A33C7